MLRPVSTDMAVPSIVVDVLIGVEDSDEKLSVVLFNTESGGVGSR